jgi:hypothetical protein
LPELTKPFEVIFVGLAAAPCPQQFGHLWVRGDVGQIEMERDSLLGIQPPQAQVSGYWRAEEQTVAAFEFSGDALEAVTTDRGLPRYDPCRRRMGKAS